MTTGAPTGFELIYDSSGLEVPNNEEWESLNRYSKASTIYYGGTYNDNAIHIVNSDLKIAMGHPYSQWAYYPMYHGTAENCYAAVEFKKTSNTQIAIHLTDGTLSAMGVCRISEGMVNIHTTSTKPWNGVRIWVGYQDTNLFEVEKEGTVAYYYLNDRLVYTQTNLFNTADIATGGAGTGDNPNNNGFVVKRQNAIAVGYGVAAAYITKMIYKEG